MGNYAGKRFAAFMVSVVALVYGALTCVPESFPVFASTVGILFGAYVTGQSATDYAETRNDNG